MVFVDTYWTIEINNDAFNYIIIIGERNRIASLFNNNDLYILVEI